MRLANAPRAVSAFVALLSVAALAGCGESSEEKAQAQVCSARADISKQITTITTLPISTSAPSELKTGVEAIAADLKKIKDAQPDLQPARKAEVEKATEEFGKQLTTTVNEVTSGLSLSNAEAKVKSAASTLLNSYKQTLKPISCS